MVYVRLVTVHAFLERQRLFEVTTAVTLHAIDRRMFSQQRILSLGVIETLVDRGERKFLPAARVVARLASLHEAATVRITMAIQASRERNSSISWFVVRPGRMAFLAGDGSVQSGKRIAGSGVVELVDCDGLPIGEVVTLQTV